MGLPLETIELPDTYPPVDRLPHPAGAGPPARPGPRSRRARRPRAGRVGGPAGRHRGERRPLEARRRLGGPERRRGLAGLPADDRLVALFEAVAERREVQFRYRDLDRTVDPWRLGCTRGRWYLTGHDHGRDGTGHYRVDRIEGGVTTGPPGAFTRPQGTIEGVRMEAWAFGPGPTTTARILVDAGHVATATGRRTQRGGRGGAPRRLRGARARGQLGRPVPLPRGRLPRARRGARPPELRAAMVDWLTTIADQVPAG